MLAAAQSMSTMAPAAAAAANAAAVWGGLRGHGIVKRLDWIFDRKVEESINANSNHKLHPKSYIVRGGGGQHILRTHRQVHRPSY